MEADSLSGLILRGYGITNKNEVFDDVSMYQQSPGKIPGFCFLYQVNFNFEMDCQV